MNPEVEEIKELLLSKIDEHVAFLKKTFDKNSSLLQFELQLKKDLNEYGRILFEKMFPVIFGDGYEGSKVVKYDKDYQEDHTYSCVIRHHPRTLKSIFGEVKVIRAYYQDDQTGGSLGLLDRTLDFQARIVTPGVRYFAGLLGITTSYKEGEDIFKKFMGVSICSKDIDSFTTEKAKEIKRHFNKRIEGIKLGADNEIEPAAINACEDAQRIVYFETDGCFVPVRNEESDEEDNDWKECKTLLLFETQEVETKSGKKEQQVVRKKYFSSVSKVGYFKKQVKRELEKYCGNDRVKIVCVGDGASWIWKMVKELLPKGKVEILDWYHVKEKITLLAAELFPDDRQANDKEMFINEMKGLIFTGKTDKCIENLKEWYAKTNNRKHQAKIYDTFQYFQNNIKRMNYEQYKNEGFCIGSGAIESANKNVIQRRIKLPGCRWLKSQANIMAHTRAEYMNGNFDEWYGIKKNPMLAVT